MSMKVEGHDAARPRIPASRRWRMMGLALGFLLAGVGVWFVFHRPGPAAPARAIGARLDLAAGDVTVTEAAAATKALSGTPLAIGSRIATGKGARALVRTGDGAAVFLRGDTEIVLLEHGIDLGKGELWLDAPRAESDAIEVKLGEHTARASDAGLSVRRDGDDATVYVARGLAILTSPGGRTEVNAGERGTAHAKDAPKVSAVAFWQDWTGGMADQRPLHGAAGSGSGRIYGIDPHAPPGSPARGLGVAQQTVRAVLRGGIAETEVDQTFSNPGSQALEGWYWFTVPADAVVTSFALETNGQLVEGEVVEKREAAAKYAAAVRAAYDPALLEWVDGRSYRARIFPIPASGTRRVVLRYTQLLPTVEGKLRYVYPLRSADPVRFDEFALSVDVGDAGPKSRLATSLDATVEPGGKLVTMRRSGYVPQADFQLEMTPPKQAPLRAWRFAAGTDQADYVMLRYAPEIDFASMPPQKGAVVVVVDTSASGDETARQLRTAEAEAILRALSDEDRFALVSVDVASTVLYPEKGLAPATDASIAAALERLSEHGGGGATDLGSMFEPALDLLHGSEQPAIVYVGDGAPTSGETSPDGLMDRMRRSLAGSRARFFAVGVGSDARHELLGELTRAGGGMYLRVDDAEQATDEALRLTSAIKTPTLTDVDVVLDAALDQPFYSATGKLSRGEELVLLARTHRALPAKVTIKGRIAGSDVSREYPLDVESGVVTGFVPSLWAAEYVRRLLGSGANAEESRAKVLDLGLTYGLMTPYTSILALDSEAAYARQGVTRRRSALRGVKLTQLEPSEERALAAQYAGLRSMGGCESNKSVSDNAAPAASAAVDTPSMAREQPVAAEATPTAAPAPMATAAAAPGADDQGLAHAPGAVAGRAPTTLPKPTAGTAAATTKGFATDKARAAQAAKVELPLAPPPPVHAVRRSLGTCSDAASRPLAERIVLWKKRIARAQQGGEIAAQYEMARVACELPDWRDQAALLDLLQQRIATEDAAQALLASLASEPDAQRYVARAILRRTVDTRLAAAVARVLFGGKVDWAKVDRELLDLDKPDAREAHLREAMLVAPGDPAGDVRLVRLLVADGKRADALAYGRRLRDRGLLTPTLAQALGDVLADAGAADEAMRTYSEVVEFDPTSPVSRRVLGDIFLRRGWYAAAHRQYKTLTDLDAQRPTSWLRLAAAAAGTGRVDEAFRVEHDVASGEGTPGADDPRYWARLWSAERLGVLLADPAKAGGAEASEGITRRLKQLQLFSGPGTLALVAWEDLDARLLLVNADAKKETLTGEPNDAGESGLFAVFVQSDAWDRGPWAIRWKSDPPGRDVKFQLVTIAWDGKGFKVQVRPGTAKAAERQQQL
ncbi:MAG TPA: VIT domain-containing protein [Polyangiaceae bacterium]|jgi:tetratricopeptide (TPR) repeat protein